MEKWYATQLHTAGDEHQHAVYLASDVDTILDDVRLWLRLDADIRRRLELPHGWDALQVSIHRSELETRDDCKRRLLASLMESVNK